MPPKNWFCSDEQIYFGGFTYYHAHIIEHAWREKWLMLAENKYFEYFYKNHTRWIFECLESRATAISNSEHYPGNLRSKQDSISTVCDFITLSLNQHFYAKCWLKSKLNALMKWIVFHSIISMLLSLSVYFAPLDWPVSPERLLELDSLA